MQLRSFLNHSWTFWLSSSFGSKPKKITITGANAVAVLVGSAVLMAGAVYLSFVAADGISRSGELDALRIKSRDQAVELQSLQSRVDDLNFRMERLRESEARVRALLGAPAPKGMGGPDVSERPPRPQGQATAEVLDEEIGRTLEIALRQEAIFQDLLEEASARNAYWAAIPTLWPVHGMVTSGFGHRLSPFTGNVSMHNGVDIAAPTHTVVRAPADGIVTFAGFDSGLGRTVRIFHGFGLETLYGHLSSIAVRTGQRLRKGARIGAVGSTGMSTGPHLHYQVAKHGVPVNPLRYLVD